MNIALNIIESEAGSSSGDYLLFYLEDHICYVKALPLVHARLHDENIIHTIHIHSKPCTDTYTHDMIKWSAPKAWQRLVITNHRVIYYLYVRASDPSGQAFNNE